MLPEFQQYLVDKGFKRTVTKYVGKTPYEEENYKDVFLSSYGPLEYHFRKDDLYCYWGLCEADKPPVMNLGLNKIIVIESRTEKVLINARTPEDGYRILFSKWGKEKFEQIYEVFSSPNQRFFVEWTE